MKKISLIVLLFVCFKAQSQIVPIKIQDAHASSYVFKSEVEILIADSLAKNNLNYYSKSQIDSIVTVVRAEISSGVSGTKQVYTGSSSVTMDNTASSLTINPSTTSDTTQIILAASPTDNQEIRIHFGGTIKSGVVVTSLSILPNTGYTILQTTNPTSVSAGETIVYDVDTVTKNWYRIN